MPSQGVFLDAVASGLLIRCLNLHPEHLGAFMTMSIVDSATQETFYAINSEHKMESVCLFVVVLCAIFVSFPNQLLHFLQCLWS